MTGFYIRVQRNGKWEFVEIEYLTGQELDKYAKSRPDEGWAWVNALCVWIKDNVKNAQAD
jgi:hypothetical protein